MVGQLGPAGGFQSMTPTSTTVVLPDEEVAVMLAIGMLGQAGRPLQLPGRGSAIAASSPPSVREWLSAHMDGVPSWDVDDYVTLLDREGATTMSLLAEAEYTRDDLIRLGVKRPHATALLRAIQAIAADDVEGMAARLEGMGISGEGSGAQREVPIATLMELISMLDAKGHKAGLALAILRALARLTSIEDDDVCATNRRRLESLGICPPLLRCMALHADDPSPLAAALELTSYLACEEGSRLTLRKEGVSSRVAEVMRNFTRDRHVCEWGCAAVQNLSIPTTKDLNSGEPDAGVVPWWREGAGQLVIGAMHTFPDDVGVCSAACAALAHLCGSELPNVERIRELGMQGACEAVVGAFGAFGQEREMVVNACTAIVYLANPPQHRNPLAAAGACELIVSALRTFAADKDVCYRALGAMIVMTGDLSDTAVRRAFDRADACRAVISVESTALECALVSQAACGAIDNLSYCDVENCRALHALGVASMVTNIACRWPEDSDLQEMCRSLSTMNWV